jgi:hypothetical protein
MLPPLLPLLLLPAAGEVAPRSCAAREERANMTCMHRGGKGLVKEMDDHTKPDDMDRILNMT